MNLLDELRRKIETFDTRHRMTGISAAVRHIEVGERYLDKGRADQDPDLFNDVVYRTNQAFEGMLKEAYAVLADVEATKLSPHRIEKYLLDGKKLSERVLGLFTTYRTQWRNPATHDHTLLFSEQEALLAIVNVSAFAVVLLDQIIETISFKSQRAETQRRHQSVNSKLRGLEKTKLAKLIVVLLKAFTVDLNLKEPVKSEAELIGRLSGFLVGAHAELQVNPNTKPEGRHDVDLWIERGNEAVVIEIKHGKLQPHYIDAAVAHLQEYLRSANVSSGILYVVSPRGSMGEVGRFSLDDSTEIWIVGAETLPSGFKVA